MAKLSLMLCPPHSSPQTIEYSLGEDSIVEIGTSSTCGLVIPKEYNFVSRCHCTIVLMPGEHSVFYVLQDGAIAGRPSTNGTWINQIRRKSVRLFDKDEITFAHNAPYPKLTFQQDEDELSSSGTCSKERT